MILYWSINRNINDFLRTVAMLPYKYMVTLSHISHISDWFRDHCVLVKYDSIYCGTTESCQHDLYVCHTRGGKCISCKVIYNYISYGLKAINRKDFFNRRQFEVHSFFV